MRTVLLLIPVLLVLGHVQATSGRQPAGRREPPRNGIATTPFRGGPAVQERAPAEPTPDPRVG